MLRFYAKILLLFILFIAGIFQESAAQEVRFTQFMNTPLLLNPALTGYSTCNRLGFSVRDQWRSFPGKRPYSTYTAFFDRKFPPRNKVYNWLIDQDWIGFGTVFYQDIAGDGLLKTTGLYFPVAALHFDKLFWMNSTHISIGAGAGVTNRKVDYDRLYFNSQWDGFLFNGTLPANENYDEASFSEWNLDASAGLFFAFQPRHWKDKITVGAAFFHATKPKDSFYYSGNAKKQNRINLHGSYELNLPREYKVEALAYYSKQQSASEAVFGINFKKNQWKAGLWNRWDRDLIVGGGYYWDQLDLFYTHDFSLSKLRGDQIWGKPGSNEISLIYRFGCSARVTNGEGDITSGKEKKPRNPFKESQMFRLMCEGYDLGNTLITRYFDYTLSLEGAMPVGTIGSKSSLKYIDFEPGAILPAFNFLISANSLPVIAPGAGIGFNYIDSTTFISLYGQLRLDLNLGFGSKSRRGSGQKTSRDNLMPYLFFDAGILIPRSETNPNLPSKNGGPMYDGGVGMEFQPTRLWRSSRMIFNLGYRVQEFNYEVPGGTNVPGTFNLHAVFLRFGVKF